MEYPVFTALKPIDAIIYKSIYLSISICEYFAKIMINRKFCLKKAAFRSSINKVITGVHSK